MQEKVEKEGIVIKPISLSNNNIGYRHIDMPVRGKPFFSGFALKGLLESDRQWNPYVVLF